MSTRQNNRREIHPEASKQVSIDFGGLRTIDLSEGHNGLSRPRVYVTQRRE